MDQWVLPLLHLDKRPSTLITMMRISRLLRVLRTLRLFRQIGPLYILATGLKESCISVFWLSVLFMVIILIAAIVCTDLIGHSADIFDDPEQIRVWFGSVFSSMYTLFVMITMDNWSAIARAVDEKIPMEVFWVAFIFLSAFTLLSVLTGLMAERMKVAHEEAEYYQDGIVQLIKDLSIVFKQSERLDAEQFKILLSDAETRDSMESMGLNLTTDEINTFFTVFDRERVGSINQTQFRDGILRLGREVESKDIMWIFYCLERTRQELESTRLGVLSKPPDEFERRISLVQSSVEGMAARMQALEERLDALFKSLNIQ